MLRWGFSPQMSSAVSELRRTPLCDTHCQLKAKLIEFGGWYMPVQYSGILQEHTAVRTAVGLFDVSHMGEALVSGPAALAWLNSLTTNDVARLSPGRAQYSLLLREDAGILDDILVYQIGDERYLLVLNASNAGKDLSWLRDHSVPGVELADVSDDTALLAVQGPGALALLAPLADVDLAGLRRFGSAFGTVAGILTQGSARSPEKRCGPVQRAGNAQRRLANDTCRESRARSLGRRLRSATPMRARAVECSLSSTREGSARCRSGADVRSTAYPRRWYAR